MTARYVFPVDGPPLESGVVTIRGDRIVAVDSSRRRQVDVDWGNAALLPGLANAHVHLDLSGLRGRCPPENDFVKWLRHVLQHRRARSPRQVEADVRDGLQACLASGTTLLADVSAQGMSWDSLSRAPVRAIANYELLGLTTTRAHEAWSGALEWLKTHPATPTCRPGLSPHAPYSVRASLFQAVSLLARARRVPMTIHLSETLEELQLLRDHHQ